MLRIYYSRKELSFSLLAPIPSQNKMLEEIGLKPYQVKILELNIFTFALRRFQLSIKMLEERISQENPCGKRPGAQSALGNPVVWHIIS